MNSIKKMIFPCGKYHKLYGSYIGWSFLSNVIVSVETVLSTHSLLSALSTNESEIVRTFNYVGKDIIGQIGSLWYLSKIGNNVDKNPKKLILYSNIIQQSSFLLNCLTPIFPESFILIAGVSNIISNISFTGFGAVNARSIQELAIDDNVGEIYAKISVVNTIGSSIGMVIGLCVSSMFPDHETRMILIPLFGLARIYTYNKCISGLL